MIEQYFALLNTFERQFACFLLLCFLLVLLVFFFYKFCRISEKFSVTFFGAMTVKLKCLVLLLKFKQ